MTPDANLQSISYNPFTVNGNFANSENDPDINFYSDISPLNTKYFNPNEISEGFECLCKTGFSVWLVNIRSINKNFEAFKYFYFVLNCKFNLKHRITSSKIIWQRGEGVWGVSIFVHKEVHCKSRTDLSINSNEIGSLCIEIHHIKDKDVLFSVMHRPPSGDMTVFENFCKTCLRN